MASMANTAKSPALTSPFDGGGPRSNIKYEFLADFQNPVPH